MADEPEKQAEMIFYQALDKEPAHRESYLKEACGDDHELYQRVDALLQAYDSDDSLHHVPLANSQVPIDSPRNIEGPGSIIGRYKLLEKIGVGGFGVVWAAEQKKPVKRRVALKIIKLGMDTKQVVARFEAERQALALMDHPNIAKVLDAGATETGRPYFVMELVRGIPVIEYCDQEKLSIRERLELFIKICHAIQHAHQKGIIHRDIKPSNILITLHDGVPVPRVIDFGIAKATQQELTEKTIYTQHHQFIGTPVYMSPEQAEMSGLDIDTRSDIYSLGVLLYELLTSKTPFDEKELIQSGIDEMRKIIREKEPQKPSTKFATLQMEEQSTTATRHATDSPRLISLLRGDLDWIVMKCLEKDRTRRYETANGIAMDIKRHFNDEPILARPPSSAYRLQKAWRRNRTAYVAGMAVVAALVVGLTLSLWQTGVTKAANDRAVRAERDKETQRLQAVSKAAEATAQRLRAEGLERTARWRAYAADMNLAQRALELDDLGKAGRLLDRYRPDADEEDLRGWEWRYLWRQIQDEALYSLSEGGTIVNDLSASANGEWLAISRGGEGVFLLNLWSRQESKLTAVDDTSERGEAYDRVTFAPQGSLLAYAQGSFGGVVDSAIRVVDVEDIQEVREFQLGAPCIGLQFTEDSTRLCVLTVGSPKSRVMVLDVSDGRPLQSFSVLEAFPYAYGSPFAATPNGEVVLVGSAEGEVAAYDTETGGLIWKTKVMEEDEVICLALSPDGRRVAAGSGATDPTVILLDRDDGSETARFVGHRAWVGGLAFLQQGRVLASSSADQTIRLWDLEGHEPPRVLHGHRREIWPLTRLTDSRLVSGSKLGAIKVWDSSPLSDDPGVTTRAHESTDRTTRLAFGPDGAAIYVARPKEGQVVRWSGDSFATREVIYEGEPERKVLFEPDGWRVALGTAGGRTDVIDLRNGTRIDTIESGPAFAEPVAFNREGSGLWMKSVDGDRIQEWIPGETTARRTVAWHFPQNSEQELWDGLGHWLIGRETDGKLRAFADVLGRTSDVRWDTPDVRSYGGAISPRLGYFAMSQEPGVVNVWRLSGIAQGESPTLRATLGGAIMSYHGVTFTGDDRRMAAGSGGSQLVTIWDTESFEAVLTLPGRGWGDQGIAFSPDGNTLACEGAALHIWIAPSWEEIAVAEAKEQAEAKQH